MTAKSYELNLTLPADARFAVMAREVAMAAASRSGCGEDAADIFGRNVESAVRRRLPHVAAGGALPVTVRCIDGPVEVVVDGHTLAVRT